MGESMQLGVGRRGAQRGGSGTVAHAADIPCGLLQDVHSPVTLWPGLREVSGQGRSPWERKAQRDQLSGSYKPSTWALPALPHHPGLCLLQCSQERRGGLSRVNMPLTQGPL